MTFTAKTPEGQIICSLDFSSKFEILDKYPHLFSPYPDCDKEVAVVDRSGSRRMHFRHPNSFKTEYISHRESPEHLAGKEYLMLYLKNKHKDDGCTIEIERPVVLQHRKRIIDVAVVRNGKVIEAHEIQISPQTPEELDERTDDYLSIGIDVTWYFGERASVVGEPWSMERFGSAGRIRFTETCESLHNPVT